MKEDFKEKEEKKDLTARSHLSEVSKTDTS